MTDLFESLKKAKDTPLGQIADKLGYLCLAWSWLELEINAMLCTLMHPSDLETAASVVNNMDMRDKFKALLAVGFVKKPSDEWYMELKTLVDQIDNDLRPERNRMVHDSWHNAGDEAFRLTTYAKVSYVQARELALHFGEGKPTTPVDISVLFIEVLAAGGHLDELLDQYNAEQAKPSPDTGA